jgi:hypothetical protein
MESALEDVRNGRVYMGDYHYSLGIMGESIDVVRKDMANASLKTLATRSPPLMSFQNARILPSYQEIGLGPGGDCDPHATWPAWYAQHDLGSDKTLEVRPSPFFKHNKTTPNT